MTGGSQSDGAVATAGDGPSQAQGVSPILLRYGHHPDQLLDVFLPTSQPSGTLLVVLHGGFWQSSVDRGYVLPMASALAAVGHVVAVPEFRRVGQDGGGWPGTLDDVALAVDRAPGLIAQLSGFGSSIRAVVVVGHSSGGHLAAWSAARSSLPESSAWSLPAPNVSGAVCLSGALDLVCAYELGLGQGATASFLGGAPGEVPERYGQADPAGLAPVVPVVVLHPAEDPVVPLAVARAYVTRTSAAGGEVTLRELPGGDHFEGTDPTAASWALMLAAIDEVTA